LEEYAIKNSILHSRYVREMKNMLTRIPTILWLSLLYIAGYLLYASIWGWGFELQLLFTYSQHLYPGWMKDDFWGSLIYLHSQPPLWNAIIGIIYILGGAYYVQLFQLLYLSAGVAILFYLHKTLLLFGISRGVRISVLSIMALFPTIHYYGTWYYSTHFELLFFTIAFYHLSAFMLGDVKRARHLAWGFIMLALLGLMRAQWHLIVFLTLAGAMLLVEKKGMRRQIITYSLIFILPLCTVYTKNYLIFGFWGGSSWMGSNLAQAVTNATPRNTMRSYKQYRLIHRVFPINIVMNTVYGVSPNAEEMSQGLPTVLSSMYKPIEVKDRNAAGNANHISVLHTSRSDMKDSLYIIGRDPVTYLKHVALQLETILSIPALFYPYHLSNPQVVIVERAHLTDLFRVAALVLYMGIPLVVLLQEQRKNNKKLLIFLTIFFWFAMGMLLIGCAFNGFEQERMRWGWQAIYVIFAAIFLENTRNWWDKRRNG